MQITDKFLGVALFGAEWVMWVLIILSLVSIAIMVERTIYFFGQRPNIGALSGDLRKLLKARDFDGAAQRVENIPGVAAAVARAAIAEAQGGPQAVDEAAASMMTQQRLRLERNLAYLGTVGSNAPFIGLFGTVIGIIKAFHDLSMNTQGGASTVMAGVSEALVATAIGLLVAIPAVAAFNVFQRRIKTLLGDADSLLSSLLSGLHGSAPSEKC